MTTAAHTDQHPTEEPTITAPDLERLRARYRAERDRRVRPDGVTQYRATTGEFSSYADDPWTDPVDRRPVTDEMDVVVVGGGFGGLTAAAKLREAGLDRIRIIDKAGDLGGTWYWNRYPGVACDIESYIYLPMLEQVGTMPSRKYAPGEEIRRHARAIGETFDLYRDALFGTEVTSAVYDEAAHRWTVRTDRGDTITTRYLIISSGPFNRPKLPGIPGVSDFTGHTFHTSRWDYAYTGGGPGGARMDRLAGKRVAVIGTGATAIQVVPHLAAAAAHLYVVQRTPSTVDTRDDAPTDPQWWASLEPGWQQRRRDGFLALLAGRTLPGEGHSDVDGVADKWTDNAAIRGFARWARTRDTEDLALAMEIGDAQKMDELRARVAEVVTDPDTAAALQPWYRQMCKRPTFSDTYLQAFNRENVTLVDTRGAGVEAITATGLVVGGVEYPVDAIVFATGFDVDPDPVARTGTDIRGRGGVTLEDAWARGPRTLHGWVGRGFPNLFHLGTIQNAVSVNFAHILEEQARHIAGVVAEAERRGGAVVEPTAEAEQAWQDSLGHSGDEAFFEECTPGYYNAEGTYNRRPPGYTGTPLDFHELLRSFRAGDMSDVLPAVPPPPRSDKMS